MAEAEQTSKAVRFHEYGDPSVLRLEDVPRPTRWARLATMQRAPGEERLFRVAYGHDELEFMLQPWFDIDVVGSTQTIRGGYDIVIAGVGKPHDADLVSALRATSAAARDTSARLPGLESCSDYPCCRALHDS